MSEFNQVRIYRRVDLPKIGPKNTGLFEALQWDGRRHLLPEEAEAIARWCGGRTESILTMDATLRTYQTDLWLPATNVAGIERYVPHGAWIVKPYRNGKRAQRYGPHIHPRSTFDALYQLAVVEEGIRE